MLFKHSSDTTVYLCHIIAAATLSIAVTPAKLKCAYTRTHIHLICKPPAPNAPLFDECKELLH
jgi:hypothetical protein